MVHLGLSSGALYPWVATDDVPLAAAALGFFDLELVLQTAGEYQPAFARKVAANCLAAGCQVHALHAFQQLHPFASPYPRRTEEAVDLFKLGIESAATLGARAVVWHGFDRADLAEPGGDLDFLRTVERLAALCAESGIALAIENVSWGALASVREVTAMAARLPELGPVGSLGFAFDPFQAAEAGANPFMVLFAMAGALLDVHLSDRRAELSGARHLPPGDGDLPWPAIIRAIVATGYSGPLMIESPVPDAQTAERVRSVLEPSMSATAASGDPCAGPPPAGVLEGIRLFNAGHYYEAHESLEAEWHAERRPLRRLYQGILQIGVGFHHARGGNHRGAVLLLTDGIEKVSEFMPACQGIDTARLVHESHACLSQILILGSLGLPEFDWTSVPHIEFIRTG